uniref:Uncharacterized protein n=1 Tax=Mycena chlorophos TaxID=658473 RepID=A0ABQ0LM55_MYCCL|nr:predicted protein [Mycena chlorophos]
MSATHKTPIYAPEYGEVLQLRRVLTRFDGAGLDANVKHEAELLESEATATKNYRRRPSALQDWATKIMHVYGREESYALGGKSTENAFLDSDEEGPR